MREIKFRAFDNEFGKMYQNVGLVGNTIVLEYDQDEDEHDFDEIYWCNKNNEDVFLMQYTGLKDKNGKEIYEGDIIKFTVNKFSGQGIEKTTKKGSVYYNNEMVLSVDGWILARVKSREIIGNIYENPELANQ